jgi:hypothetical protein
VRRPCQGSDGSEHVALSGARPSCRADRFFVAADELVLPLNTLLCNCFFSPFTTRSEDDKGKGECEKD